MRSFAAVICVLAVVAVAVSAMGLPKKPRFNEVWTREQEAAAGVVYESHSLPRPQDYVDAANLPTAYTWGNVNGVNYLTKSLNQHIPQYCGSCWAHGALSALADRVKMARNASGVDINLSVQYILNCGTAGSCHGGSATAVYQYIKNNGNNGVPYDTCQPYMACSSESQEGFCHGTTAHSNWECNALNTCRTCPTFGEPCQPIYEYPNVSVAEYGTVSGEQNMMAEIYTRGPIACGIDASQIVDYTGGIAGVGAGCNGVDHIISVVGWGVENGTKYWIVRNSWGEYYGELGYVRVAKGNNALCLESQCSWATVKTWTEVNVPCYEGGENCDTKPAVRAYVDPAMARRRM